MRRRGGVVREKKYISAAQKQLLTMMNVKEAHKVEEVQQEQVNKSKKQKPKKDRR